MLKNILQNKEFNGLPIKFNVKNNENYQNFLEIIDKWEHWIFSTSENEDWSIEVSTVVWWNWNEFYDLVKDLEVISIENNN